MCRRKKCLSALWSLVSLLSLVAPAQAHADTAPVYELTDLGTPGPKLYSVPVAMNDQGDVVGWAEVAAQPDVEHAVLFSGGQIKDLGTLGGDFSEATGINDNGDIVGFSDLPGNIVQHAFIYHDGVMHDLGTLGGGMSWASGINSEGQIVGSSYLAGTTTKHAFLYQNGMMQDIGTLPGGTISTAAAINDAGYICGTSQTSGNGLNGPPNAAFIYKDGVMTSLPTLGGISSFGTCINNLNQVGGYSFLPGNQTLEGVLFTNGTAEDLGPLGGNGSSASGVNGDGDVVGSFNVNGAPGHAFIFTNNTLYDLTSLLDASGSNWSIGMADAISESGTIAATADDGPATIPHAVLLTPVVPEPSVGGILAPALLMGVGRRTRGASR